MIAHIAMIGGLTALLVLAVFYPFLPGSYDVLALPLSAMVQASGLVGVLLVPVGIAWLAYELREQARRKRNLAHAGKRYLFALAAVITATLPAAAACFVALMTSGPVLAVFAFALCACAAWTVLPRLKALKNAERAYFSPAPLYLVVLPSALLLLPLTLADRATELSRGRAIANSSELIDDIEKYRALNGHYPNTLLAVWKDYDPAVVGIEKFHYVPQGDAYNLFFEQPKLLLDNIGTREFVVFNRLDQHLITSHAAWILVSAPGELPARQGWYAAHNAQTPHWKYFWFD